MQTETQIDDPEVPAQSAAPVTGADEAAKECSLELSSHHLELIKGSAISQVVAADRGYRTVEMFADLRRAGFSEAQRRVPALLIPIYGVTGELVTYQARPDEPRIDAKGKVRKYETPRGSRMALDVPRRARAWLSDPKRPLFITEGARKADAGVTKGLCTIALLGVWNFRGANEHGGKAALADWELVVLNGRDVYIVFDSDVMTKPEVNAALVRLKGLLELRQAKVRAVYLPPGEGGTKVGLDDFLAAGGTVEGLLALSTEQLRQPTSSAEASNPAYELTPSGLVWNKPLSDGSVAVQLTNFAATITADVVEDDGVDTRRHFEVTAEIAGQRRTFLLPADKFAAMNWPVEYLGVKALVLPGIGLRDHARAAIQSLSQDARERTAFTHTGWREIDDVGWVYLHAGGAIGPEGPEPEISTRLPAPLQRFALPDPSAGADLVADIEAELRLLDLDPAHIGFTAMAATWRAPIDVSDFSLHYVGPSGAHKTADAALRQSHWGCGLDAEHLPASWSSTGNSLELLAFAAKDATLVVDDFAPGGSATDVQRYHRTAERVVRAQGNQSGRGRATADGHLVCGRPPRGLILSTGEDVPAGHSVRSRMLVLEFVPGGLDLKVLSECQALARNGAFARAMAAFIQWVARSYPEHRAALNARAADLRDLIVSTTSHGRTATTIGELQAGFELFLAFAVAVNAIATERAQSLKDLCWQALQTVATSQSQHQQAAEPTALFLDLLAAAIGSGGAHLADKDGNCPAPSLANAVGWRRRDATDELGSDDWHALGARIGWIDGDDIYLNAAAAHKAVQCIGSDTERLAISAKTLTKRLAERGLLASQDQERGKHQVRRTLQGTRRDVLHLRASSLGLEALGAQPAHDSENTPRLPAFGPETWAPNSPVPRVTDPQLGPSSEAAGRDLAVHQTEAPGDCEASAHSTTRRASATAQPCTETCRGCGTALRWRLVGGATDVCGTCSPPDDGVDVEWWSNEARSWKAA